ncbi:MAG: phosphoribosyltransferase family protein [Deltaproteobacteria bacterium]|nr:phosphoribosyltransferase family protein [Deltaproteobacteria bacterium]
MLFRDRTHAGQLLACHLQPFADRADVVVLALPRGGVPVAFEVANALHLPLDVIVARKLGLPGQPEYAMGAIAGDVVILNQEVVDALDLDAGDIATIARRESAEIERRTRLYRVRPALELAGKTVLVVDDGLATGNTMRAAVAAIRKQKPARVVVVVPVAAAPTCESMRSIADDVVCLRTPAPFRAVGQWYADFSQVSDDEVRRLLLASSSTEHAELPAS